MKLAAAFFRMVRWKNLLFIFITQGLFYYSVCQTVYHANADLPVALLIIASVCIAAAGYIINDYFDLNIDQVNKPSENVVNSIISRRWAIVWHMALSLAGILLTVMAVGFSKWYIIIANAGVVFLLWIYSTSLKKKLLIGNVLISLLTAWTVLVIFFALSPLSEAFRAVNENSVKFFRISFLYAAFAFIISLIREAVKDVEDMEGDMRYGCRTFPIVAGVMAVKVYTTVWIIVLLAALIILQLYILHFGWWPAVIYSVVFVVLPVFYLFRQHVRARTKQDFASLSSLCKLIMLTGILSMIFFRVYF